MGLPVTPTAAARPIGVALALLAVGCARTAETPGFAVRVDPAALTLVNRDTAPVYFTVFEHQTAMVVRWAPCREASDCQRVPPKSERRFPLDSIAGYAPGAAAAILYWYQLRPDSAGGMTYDSVRSVNLSLSDTAK